MSEKKDKAEKPLDLKYHFNADGLLTGASYAGPIDADAFAKIKVALLAAREAAKGR